MAIAHNFKETYKNSITVKWNTSESATYCTATKWFAFEDEILVVIFKNRLGIISEEKPLQIVSKSKGVMSVESGTIYPLHDVYMLKTSTSTIIIHCSNIY